MWLRMIGLCIALCSHPVSGSAPFRIGRKLLGANDDLGFVSVTPGPFWIIAKCQ